MYTVEFLPSEKQETIGILIALKDAVPVYKNSVNLGDLASVKEFVEKAKEAGIAPPKDTSKIDTLLTQIETQLNK